MNMSKKEKIKLATAGILGGPLGIILAHEIMKLQKSDNRKEVGKCSL